MVIKGRAVITGSDGSEQVADIILIPPPAPWLNEFRKREADAYRWWAVATSRPANGETWLEHAIHGRGRALVEVDPRTLERRLHRPALCGAVPTPVGLDTSGCWDRIGDYWNPERTRRTWRVAGHDVPNTCPQCEQIVNKRNPK